MGGCHCTAVPAIQKPIPFSVPILDQWVSKRHNRLKNEFLRKNLMVADEIVFQSEFSRQLTQHFVCRTQPGVIIPNGIPLDLYQPEGPVDSSMAGRLNVLIAHHFRPFHRLHDAFKILAQLKKSIGNHCHFHIVGCDDGKSISYALETAKRLYLKQDSDFTLWGKPTSEHIRQLYRSCDLMLNLSYWDTSPNTVLEAIASSLPVVGVKSGAVPEWTGEAGLMVDETIPMHYLPHDNFKLLPKAPAAHYAAAILNILGNLEEYRQLAYQRAQGQYDIHRIAKLYIEIAEKTCENAASFQTPSQELVKLS